MKIATVILVTVYFLTICCFIVIYGYSSIQFAVFLPQALKKASFSLDACLYFMGQISRIERTGDLRWKPAWPDMGICTFLFFSQ